MSHRSPGQLSYGEKGWGPSSTPLGAVDHAVGQMAFGDGKGDSAPVLTQPPG